MRLIDKDRLLKGSNHYWLEMENFGDIESIDVRFVEMAEEVKAIPIDWLVAKAKEKVLAQGKKFYSILDLPIVYDLIEEWKKENESY